MKWFSTAVVLLAATGCATAPVPRNFDTLADYPGASFTEVGDAVIQVLGDRNWVIANFDRDNGIIATDLMTDVDASYWDCGSAGFRATHSDHAGRVDVVVREIDDEVSIRVTTSWQVVRNSSRSIDIVECLSTGVLERELHDAVRRRLRSGGG